jgi:hypothetical protein
MGTSTLPDTCRRSCLGIAMKTIQSQAQNEDLVRVMEKIVRDLEDSRTDDGRLFVERVLPPPGASADTPVGYPHLTVQQEKRVRLFGLIPYNKKKTVFIVKEGFYDIEDKGRKDMLVMLRSKGGEAVIREHLEEYGRRNQVTEIVYWGRARLRPERTVSP